MNLRRPHGNTSTRLVVSMKTIERLTQTIHPSSRALTFAAFQASLSKLVFVGLCAPAQDELRLTHGFIVGRIKAKRSDEVALIISCRPARAGRGALGPRAQDLASPSWAFARPPWPLILSRLSGFC